MFSHVTIGTHDLERATAFYDATLAPLGIERVSKKYPDWSAWQRRGEEAIFWVGRPFNRLPASSGNGTMVAFKAQSRAAVDAAYAAALKVGGMDDGPPGFRPNFGPDYYGAYIRDPDGNKIHFVLNGGPAVSG
jgi:catechol 2,3-dioxygenase-like lactoylglutathione lyase family enzyme